MKAIAVIPARGGSKRIPKKNIVDFAGKPMIAWTIEAAKASGIFSDVFVNTDSNEIAEIAHKYGAKTVFLRDQYGDDQSTVSQATTHYISGLINHGYEFDWVCQLMANCPLRSSGTIFDFCNYFIENNLDNLISIVKPKFGNPFWSLEKKDDGRGLFMFKDKFGARSQDLPEIYYPTGSIWIAKKNLLLGAKSFYSDSFNVKEISWIEAIDIDDPDELEIAKKFKIDC